jgi:dTDP-4-dehydrorhamnose reductase
MKKILILGGSGMLGHEFWLEMRAKHETWVTVRRPIDAFLADNGISKSKVIEGLDISNCEQLEQVVNDIRPEVVLNCIGIIKQIGAAKDPIQSISVNALLPHRLARICEKLNSKLILFSTDCVFSGKRGMYSENDIPDANDLYGRSKLLGEISDKKHVITLRSSIIGRELGTSHSLVEWFINHKGSKVEGYRRAIYSGFTTIEMARIVERFLMPNREFSGLWHVASDPISKFQLLLLLKERFKLAIEVEPNDVFCCDRSLSGMRFNQATGYQPPDWATMIDELAKSSERSSG